MWQSIVSWFKSLFSKVQEPEQQFSGWVQDTPDARDQIFEETK